MIVVAVRRGGGEGRREDEGLVAATLSHKERLLMIGDRNAMVADVKPNGF